ncbi:MAG: T9SS type A sorting domain-containing protein [Bacteroidales bacterium]|nr:T9SS type A sorting domain-containing protein [Bacteroidales bacterium]
MAERDPSRPLRLHVYPNPATESIYIVADMIDPGKSSLISVLDLSGRMILQRETRSGEIPNIGISSLSPGAYLVTLSEQGKSMPLGTALFIKN